MNDYPEGRAIVYCEGAFGTTNGKTAHGLVRRSRRYAVSSVVDSVHADHDAGQVLDGKTVGIPVVGSLEQALGRDAATHFVVGLAPDGGRLDPLTREAIRRAICVGLHVDCGLHDFISEDPEIAGMAERFGVRLRDIRKPPPRSELHFFSGKIEEVESYRIAVLGTDSAVGKRTTAWMLADALTTAGHPAEMIGTGQTSWLQGARHGIVLDSLVNDFVSGEIEHAIWSCWNEHLPEVMVLEGQGSLMNPAYPGGFELLAAGRPHAVVLQHAPARRHYDGFPRHKMHPIEKQIEAIKLLSGKPVVAVTVNHEGMDREQTEEACASISVSTGLPAIDVLFEGTPRLVDAVRPFLTRARA
jgi:uncharacterized NAD-dependent epimerase/dehydratase family protein